MKYPLARVPIPETQLSTWSNQGAVVASKTTADSIRHALDSFSGWNTKPTYEIYLQGSYRNDTNIYGDSDVDVVVQLDSSFQFDVSELPPADLGLFQAQPNG